MSDNLEGKAESDTEGAESSSFGKFLSLSQPEVYVCSRCKRGFPSSQSLGGHQNAHRGERNAERNAHRRLAMAERLTKMGSTSTQVPVHLSHLPVRLVPTVDGRLVPRIDLQMSSSPRPTWPSHAQLSAMQAAGHQCTMPAAGPPQGELDLFRAESSHASGAGATGEESNEDSFKDELDLKLRL